MSDGMIVLCYLIGCAVVGTLTGLFSKRLGIRAEVDEDGLIIFIGIIFWPAVLAVFALICLVFAPFHIGKYLCGLHERHVRNRNAARSEGARK